MAKKKEESPINIKPSKEGSFRAACKRAGYGGVNQKCIDHFKKSKSTAMKKKATFAENARLWNRG